MEELVIASNNPGKIREIRSMLSGVSLLSLMDIGFMDDILEPFHTFEENAAAKARTIYRFCGKNVFSDDSGLCVNSLNGEPGVNSAHFSGERDDEKKSAKSFKSVERKGGSVCILQSCSISDLGWSKLSFRRNLPWTNYGVKALQRSCHSHQE